MSVIEKMLAKDVNGYTEKKNGLTYLSWANAWQEVLKECPDATYTIEKNTNGLPYFGEPEMGYMVYTTVTIDEITREMWLPVMDNNNRAMLKESHTYKKGQYEKECAAINMFDVNKAIMRCLTKNLAMFGLGLYIYAGEDFPEEPVISSDQLKDALTLLAEKGKDREWLETNGKCKLAELPASKYDSMIKWINANA